MKKEKFKVLVYYCIHLDDPFEVVMLAGKLQKRSDAAPVLESSDRSGFQMLSDHLITTLVEAY